VISLLIVGIAVITVITSPESLAIYLLPILTTSLAYALDKDAAGTSLIGGAAQASSGNYHILPISDKLSALYTAPTYPHVSTYLPR
jgi:hypothetical protein